MQRVTSQCMITFESDFLKNESKTVMAFVLKGQQQSLIILGWYLPKEKRNKPPRHGFAPATIDTFSIAFLRGMANVKLQFRV